MTPTFSDTSNEERQILSDYCQRYGNFSYCKIGDSPDKREAILDHLFENLIDEPRWQRVTGLEKHMVISWLSEAKNTGYIRMELVTMLCMPPKAKKNFKFEDMAPGRTVTFDLPTFPRR